MLTTKPNPLIRMLDRKLILCSGVVFVLFVLLFAFQSNLEWKEILLDLIMCYGVILGILYPVYALGFVIVLLPLKTLYARGNWVYLPKVAMIIPILGFLAGLALHRGKYRKFRLTGLEAPVVFITLLIMFHLFNSYKPSADLVAIWYFWGFLGLMIAIVNLLVNDRLLKIGVSAWILSGLVPAFAAWYQWLTGQPILGAEPNYLGNFPRATGTFFGISGLGAFLNAYLVFGVSLIALSPIPLFKKRLIDWLIVLGCSTPLLFSLNKAGVAGSLLGLLYLAYRLNIRRILRRRAYFAVLAGSMMVIFVLSNPAWQLRIFGREGAPPSYEYRINEVKMVLNILHDHPLEGTGLGNYSLMVQNLPERIARVPHSLLLFFVAIGGIFGLVALIWIIIKVAGIIKRTGVLEMEILSFPAAVVEAAVIALIGYSFTFLTHGALGSDSHWILLGFLIAGSNICRLEKGTCDPRFLLIYQRKKH